MQQLKANQTAYERNRVVGSTATAPLRSTKSLTIPRSPHLRLNDRHGEKQHPPPPPRGARGAGDVAVELFYKPRPPSPTAAAAKTGPKSLTIPVGPALHTDSRAQIRRAASPTAAASTGMESFAASSSHAQPPPLRTGGLHLREYEPKPPSPRSLTIPQSPHLSTNARAAVRKAVHPHADKPHVMEQEEKELEECKHQFKARPLDRRILQSTGEMGVPKVAKSDVTLPQPFHFKTDERVRRPTSADQDRDGFESMKEPRRPHEHRHEQQQHQGKVHKEVEECI